MKRIASSLISYSSIWDFTIDGGAQGNYPTGIFPQRGSIIKLVTIYPLAISGPGAPGNSTVNLMQGATSFLGGPKAIAGNYNPGILMADADVLSYGFKMSNGNELVFVIGGADPFLLGLVQITVDTIIAQQY